MHAAPGDWLTVNSGSDSRHARRAVILTVADGGAPPYTVRWLDDGHEGLLYPGPDAIVVTAQHQAEIDAERAARAERVQSEITERHHVV